MMVRILAVFLCRRNGLINTSLKQQQEQNKDKEVAEVSSAIKDDSSHLVALAEKQHDQHSSLGSSQAA